MAVSSRRKSTASSTSNSKTPQKSPRSATKKKGRKMSKNTKAEDLDDGKDAQYDLPNQEEWSKLAKYRSFVLSGEKFNLGDPVFVMSDPGSTEQDWVAVVKDIRARNASAVFLLAQWFYRPEELPGGRKEYHGRDELVWSNYEDIIPVGSCNGHAIVTEWNESDNKQQEITAGYYWRQEIDTKTMKLSKILSTCICRQHYNPDHKMLYCSHCKAWYHLKCIKNHVNKGRKSNGAATGSKRTHAASVGREHIIRGGSAGVVGNMANKNKRLKSESGVKSEAGEGNEDGTVNVQDDAEDSDEAIEDDEQDKIPQDLDLFCPRCDKEI